MRLRLLASCLVGCAALLGLTFDGTARADFRVFEANAPPRPAPTEPRREGLGAVLEHEIERSRTAAAPDAPTPPAPTPPAPQPPAPQPDASGAPAPSPTEAPPAATEPSPAEALPAAPEPSAHPQAAPPAPSTEAPALEAPAPEAPAPEAPARATEARPLLDDHRWLDITGFLQPGFIARFDDPADGVSIGNTDETFWLQRARLGARAQLFSWLRFRVEVEFTPTTSLQDGFVDIVPHPFFNVRAGQFIVPFLRTFGFNEVNLGYIDRAIYTPVQFERGYLRYLAPRDMGIQLYGAFGDRSPERTDPVFEYTLAVMNGRGPNLPINDDFVFLYAGRLNLHLFGAPRGVEAESDIARNSHARTALGLGGYSNCDDRGNWNRGVTFDAELRYEGVYASGAFVWLRNSPGEGTAVLTSQRCTGTPGPIPGVQADFVSRAAHLQLQWALPRVWRELGAPLDQMDLEVLARFDWVDGNSPYDGNFLGAGGIASAGYIVPTDFSNPDNPPTRWRLTFGLNYFPTGQQTLKLSLNYQLNREDEEVDTGMGRVRQVANDVLWVQATVAL